MIYLIILNFILIIWLYIKYIHIPHKANNLNEIIDKLDPALIGYIDNENGNPIDWILAEVMELNRKKYITIEQIRIGVDKYYYKIRKNKEKDITELEKYELTAYRLLFDFCDEVTMEELEVGIKQNIIKARDAFVKGFSIRNEIEEKLEELEMFGPKIKKHLKIFGNLYSLITILIASLIKNIEISMVAVFLIQTLIIFLILKKSRGLTVFGRMVSKVVKQYKAQLEDNDLLKTKKLAHNIVLEKEYANAVALHIMNNAEEEFINDELNVRTNASVLSYWIIVIYYVYWLIKLYF